MAQVESNYPRDIVTRYHTKVFSTWLSCLPMVSAAAALITVLGSGIGTHREPIALLVEWVKTLAVCFVSLLPALAVICRSFPITVSNDGIRSFNGFGAYELIKWTEVADVPPMNILGLRYFRVKKSGVVFATLIPFDLVNRETFLTEVARHLGDDHPFVKRLRRSWRSGAAG